MADVRELSNEDLIYHWIITARELQESRRMKDTIEDELTSRLEQVMSPSTIFPRLLAIRVCTSVSRRCPARTLLFEGRFLQVMRK